MITETKTRKVEPDLTVFEISGRLNLGNSLITVENAIRRLIDDGARKLAVDLSGLNAIDSSGIGMLVSVCGHIEQKGGRLRVAGAQGAVSKALAVVHGLRRWMKTWNRPRGTFRRMPPARKAKRNRLSP